MSLRTKLIIATLFLLMLAVPMGYIVLTWSPANPLRFRLMAPESAAKQVSEGVVSYEIEVRNTTSVDIQMFSTNIVSLDPSGKPLGDIGFFQSHTPSPLYNMGYSHVPAYGTIRCTANVGAQDVQFITAGDVRVSYDWISQTRHQSMNARRWIGKLLFSKARMPYHGSSLEELNCDTDLAELAPATDAFTP